ncbi:hypothetical protein HDU67_005039, partial [Dinochytrium kinnereticum]
RQTRATRNSGEQTESEFADDQFDGATLAGRTSTLRTLNPGEDLPDGGGRILQRGPSMRNQDVRQSHQQIRPYPERALTIDPSLADSASSTGSYLRAIVQAHQVRNDHTARWVDNVSATSVDVSRLPEQQGRPIYLNRTPSVPSLYLSGVGQTDSWTRLQNGGARIQRSPSAGNTIPPRAASIQRSIDSLLDEGSVAFSSGLHDEAASRWAKARDCAIVEGDLFLEARALSNLAVSLRYRGRVTEAINALWDAWTATEELIAEAALENELGGLQIPGISLVSSPTASPTSPTQSSTLPTVASEPKNPWVDLIMKNVPMLRALPLGSRRRRHRDYEASDETGSIFSGLSRENSMPRRSDTPVSASTGTLYDGVGGSGRNYGSLGRDSTLRTDFEGYDGAPSGLRRNNTLISSGIYSIGQELTLDGEDAGSRAGGRRRPMSLNIGRNSQVSGNSLALAAMRQSAARTPDLSRPNPVAGPPIVVWLLDLTTNIGNVHFAAGEVKEAERWHAACLALTEATLEKYPIMQPIESPPEATTGAIPLRPKKKRALPFDLQRVRLSYLHRSCLHAKSRSLTHLSLCSPHIQSRKDSKRPSHAAAASIASLLASSAAHPASPTITTASSSSRTEIFRSLQAAVAANSAVTWAQCVTAQAPKGSSGLHRALERLETAGRLYRSAGDELGVSRVEATLGALCVEVGRCVDGVRWVRRFGKGEAVEAGKEKIGKAGREGGPGRMWIEKGVKLLQIHVESLKSARDWWGMAAALANLGIAYTLLNQPHLALHFLSRVMDPADPPSTLSTTIGSNSTRNLPPPPTPIPQPLLQGIRVSLWQALAALASTGKPPWYPAPSTTGLPAPPTSEPVNALIRFVTGNDNADVVRLTLQGLDDLLLRPFKDRRAVRALMWCSSARLSVDDGAFRGRMVRRCLDLDLVPTAVTGENPAGAETQDQSGHSSQPQQPRDLITAILSIDLSRPSPSDPPQLFRVALNSPSLLCLAVEELSAALKRDPDGVSAKSTDSPEKVTETLSRTAGAIWGRRLGVCEECCLDHDEVGVGVSAKVVYVGPVPGASRDKDTPPPIPPKDQSLPASSGQGVVGKLRTAKFPCPHAPWNNAEFV